MKKKSEGHIVRSVRMSTTAAKLLDEMSDAEIGVKKGDLVGCLIHFFAGLSRIERSFMLGYLGQDATDIEELLVRRRLTKVLGGSAYTESLDTLLRQIDSLHRQLVEGERTRQK